MALTGVKIGDRVVSPGGRHGTVNKVYADVTWDSGTPITSSKYDITNVTAEVAVPKPPPATASFKGINASLDLASLQAVKALGVNCIRTDWYDGKTNDGRPFSEVVSRAASLGIKVLPIVNSPSVPWSNVSYWTAQAKAALPFCVAGVLEFVNEEYGWWYETGFDANRPAGASHDHLGFMKAHAAVIEVVRASGTGIKVITAGEGKIQGKPPTYAMSDYELTPKKLEIFKSLTGTDLRSHPNFGGWSLHIYEGDPNAFGKIKRHKDMGWGPVYVTECGHEGTMTGAVTADLEVKAITEIYGTLKSMPDHVKGAYYFNQDRIKRDSSGKIAAALKAA